MELEREKALIIAVKRPKEEIDLEELKGLIKALGGEVVGEVVQKRRAFSPSTYIGRGKLEELKNREATLIVSYHPLTFSQKRNIEELTGVPVIDRTEVILEIFSRRARTKEAKLQVELARNYYLLSHLKGFGKELSRLGGGVGTRGPGETKSEIEARRIRRRIYKLKRELEEVLKRGELLRKGRKKKGFKTVAVVGYTNVGKSTLVRTLTKKEVFVKDMPFATLDVKTGSLYLGGEKLLVSDTVGFIRDLPHELIASFRATLSEVKEADLLLIVFDVSSPKLQEEIDSVCKTLKKLKSWEKPKVYVGNKADKVVESEKELEELYEKVAGLLPEPAPVVFTSAVKGWGIDKLKSEIGYIVSKL